MGYEIAINKAWDELKEITQEKNFSVRFLGDEYSLNLADRKIISLACNIPAKDFTAILLLHYLKVKLKGLPRLTGNWVSFKEFSGVEGYYPAFRKRSIEPIIRKYGSNPEGLLAALDKFPSRKVKEGDVGIVLEVLEGLPAMVLIWRSDEEFGPEANMLFDQSISKIFCTEDIVVLAGIIASQL